MTTKGVNDSFWICSKASRRVLGTENPSMLPMLESAMKNERSCLRRKRVMTEEVYAREVVRYYRDVDDDGAISRISEWVSLATIVGITIPTTKVSLTSGFKVPLLSGKIGGTLRSSCQLSPLIAC